MSSGLSATTSAALRLAAMGLLLAATVAIRANPTGGSVTSGSASISSTPGTVTVSQLSNTAVINWQTFSIGAGEMTKFVQPSSASATLNRVLGGQMSVIDGTLSSNGQVYLLNGNGILIGPGGAVSTAGFTASTRDISDADFASGNLHFTGTGSAGVTNLGSVSALGGDIIFIGKTVDNEGVLNAPNGHVGMAAADDVLVSQTGMEHVFVNATASPTSAAGKTGVNNSGTITAAAAELKAANGNIYALATNNSGIIRATGVANEGGQIWLVAEGNQGTTQNTGTLAARSSGGQGGTIETSGGTVVAHGTVDAGQGGTWLVDPTDITIDAPTATTIVTSLNAGSTVLEDSSAAGAGAGNITVTAPISWTGAGTLDLFAYANLTINQPITGNAGSLAVRSSYNGGSGTITTGSSGTISVANFAMDGGSWNQNNASLPAFTATNFTITAGSFLRVTAGNGTTATPYQVVDAYGLQGIGSSTTLLSDTWRQSTAIDASGTSGWNGGSGFVPIGSSGTPFTGTFNGNGDAISNLLIHLPAATNVGLFGDSSGTILDVIMSGAAVTGLSNVGALVGNNSGSIATSNVAGTIKGTNGATSLNVGGFVGLNSGPIDSSFSATAVTGYGNTGGFVGSNTGLLTSDYSTGSTASFLNASLSGSNIGGLVGLNTNASIIQSYTTGSTNATDTADVGGLVGTNTGGSALINQGQARGSSVVGYSQVGGLVGSNAGSATIMGGLVIDGSSHVSVTGTIDVGGVVGNNSATVTESSVVTSAGGSILGKDSLASAANIGGFVGTNSGTVSDSFALIASGEFAGTTDAQFVGGFAGDNTAAGTLTGIYSTGNVSAAGATNVGGLVGGNAGTLGAQSNASGNVTGAINVGGLVGTNTGTLGTQSFATGTIVGTTFVGGLIGINTTSTTVSTVYWTGASVTGTSEVGGLIGSNVSGNFTLSTASGNVNGSGTEVGGLMGHNGGNLTLDAASGNVSAAAASDVGGLVGDNSGIVGSAGASLGQNTASGNVTGNSAVGGLVGNNSGTVGDPLGFVATLAQYANATGNVTGHTLVGGLVGDNSGTVQQSSASNAVNGSSSATVAFGGLVGRNETAGTITTSFSSSTVQGNGTGSTNGAATDSEIGGLVGANLGSITASYSTGVTVGDLFTGGLVGLDNGAGLLVQTSYSTGNVTGLVSTGGLVGWLEAGTVTENYSTSVTVGTTNTGGLVGLDGGAVTENYSTGAVTGTANVGGLIGQIASGGALTQSYSTGATSGGTASGLVGLNGGTITGSYWDGTTTGTGATGVGSGSSAGATELTSANAYASGSYTGFGTAGSVSGAASNVVGFTSGSVAWYMFEGATRPYLAWEAPENNPVVGGAHVIYTAHQLQLVSANLGDAYVLGKGIDLSETQQAAGLWNTATGFVPISAFSGSFSGGSFGISNLYINTPAADNVGLFGSSSGSLSGVSLSGNVTGHNNVGLLVGSTTGPVSGARLSGTVTGTADVGGLAGNSVNTISSAAVNVTVNGGSDVGGIVGNNSATLEDSYSLGAVNGTSSTGDALGGLVGINYGTVTISYSTGAVTGPGTTNDVGGVAGVDNGTVSQSYSTGALSGNDDVGGVAGYVNTGASVTQSYSTGTVAGASDVGGVAGLTASGSSVTRSYASGADTGTTSVGGDIGSATSGTVYSNLFWDHVTTTQALSIGTDGTTGNGASTDLHGDTIDANTATYAGLSSSTGFAGGFDSSVLVYGSGDNVWRIQKGSEFPLLTQLSTQVSGTSYSDPGHTTPAAGATVTLNGTSQLSSTVTDGSGNFDFLFAADVGLLSYLPHTNETLRINDSGASADSIAAKLFNGNGVPDLLASLTSADTWGATVRVVSSGLTNALVDGAGSSFVSNPGGNAFGGSNTSVSENFDIGSTAGSYSITGDITANGNFAVDSASSVPSTFDHPVTLNASASGASFTVNAQLSSGASNRAIVVESNGNFINNVGTTAFSTPSGTWIVYSTNPPGSGQSIVDTTNGLNQLHLYGTNYMQTPAYHLDPGLDYQIYSFTPTITLTATAGPTNPTTLIYGAATPTLQFIQSGLLPGDTITAGQTFNQVISNQPGESTTYSQYSNVGTYPVTFIGSTLPTSLIGYNIVFAAGSIIVNPATGSPVVITVSGSQPFGLIGGGQSFTVSNVTGSVAGDPNFHPTFNTTANGTTVTQFTNVNYSGGVVIPYTGTISLIASSVSNYTGSTFSIIDNGFTVTPANLSVTASGTSIYGNSIISPVLTSNSTSSAGTIYDDSGTGSTVLLSSLYTTTPPVLTSASPAGMTSFSVSGPSGSATVGGTVTSNYNITVVPGTYTITPRPVVVNATTTVNYVYDGTPGQTAFGSSDYTVTAATANTGLINGDIVSGNMGRAQPTNGNVGFYTYNVGTLGTETSSMVANSGNYTFTFSNAGSFGFNITPLAVTISILKGATDQYGSADPAFTFANGYYGVTTGALASGDGFTAAGIPARTAGTNASVTPYTFTGLGTIGIATSGGTGTSTTSDYTLTFSNPGPYGLTITQAPLIVTANNDSKTYNGVAYSGGNGVGITGFKYTDNAASLGGTLAYSGTSQGAINAGSYVITPGGYASGNYTFSYVSGSLTVGQAPLTVTADPKSKTYGAADPTLTFTPSGTLYGTDTYSVISGVTLATTTGAAATAGTHPITATGGTAANYAITDVPGTLTVAKANLTVTATNSASTTYGTAPVVSYVVGGTLYYGDTASVVSGVTLLSTFGPNPVVGVYSATPFGGVAANYNITDLGVTNLTVTPATLYATANNQTKVYGAADPSLTFTLSGQLFYGDTYGVVSGVSVATSTGAAATVGTHPIVTTGGVASNYTIVDVNGTLNVTPATLYATADNQSKTYGGADPTLTYSPSGTLYYGDTYGVISGVGLSTVTGAAATAGTHTITATGGSASNYTVIDGNGTLTVAKANATVTASNESKVYGATDPTLAYTVAGLVYGDPSSVVSGVGLSTTTGAAATAGTHVINATGGLASNYNITDLNGTLTVTPATLTITADPQAKYAGSTFTFTNGDYTTNGLVYGDTVSGATLTSAGAPASAVPGTYPILLVGGSVTGTNITNYTIVYVSAPLVNIVSKYEQIPLSWDVRAGVAQTIGAEFDASYGEKQFFELEVPGTISRMIPTDLSGIGVGSSLVDVRIGLEAIYSLDRFQSFRH